MKTALLTGSTGEIGSAILDKFAAHQYQVIAPPRTTLDLQDSRSIQLFLETFAQPLDAFVHCAGFNNPKTIADLSVNDIANSFQVNALSFYHLCQHFLNNKLIKSAGSILAVSSIYGHFSRKGRLAYSTSKHALNSMIKTLAIEVGPLDVKVNAVSPGFVDTKMTSQNNSKTVIEDFKNRIPLRRLAKPADIAEIVYFLCSPQNNYISGQCIIADGGYSAGGFQIE